MQTNEDNGTIEKGSDDDKMRAEIAKILDGEKPVEEPENKTAEETVDAPGNVELSSGDAPANEAYSPDDAMIERAVRAGLTLEDAKGFSSQESAERILSAIEAKSTTPGKESAGAEEPADDVEIPELSDEALDDLDPSVANFIKGQTAVLKALKAEVSTLKKAGISAEAKGFFETQYGSLDEKVRGHVDAVAKAKLKQKFEMLEAGYKATGVKVERADVFKEAVSIALGDAVTRAASETKAAKVAARKGLVIAPAGGSSGHKAPVGDGEYADIIAALKEKGFE
jgi:hypothetical protein